MTGTPARGSAARRYTLLLTIAAGVVLVDQLTKQLALSALGDGPIDVIDHAISLRLTYNSGGAFGVMQGLPGVFLAATLAIVALILLWTRKVEDTGWIVALGLVVGGGLGNVADRLFRDLGGRVVDFIDFHVWPVFNVADACIVSGVILVILVSGRPRAGPSEGVDPP